MKSEDDSVDDYDAGQRGGHRGKHKRQGGREQKERRIETIK